MPRRPSKPAPPPPDDAYRAWKAAALAELEKRSGSRVTTMRESAWTNAFIRGVAPEEVAKVAETYQHNARVTGKRKR